jgi:DNA-binding transcriptional MerR regulator
MFRIGDFSRIARVSARLLRFYDEIGLFVPAHADPQSGYRYYTVAQLGELNRILVLKDLGFNLDQVREIVSKNIDPAELRKMLLLRRNDVERTLAVETQRLRQIETRILQIETEGTLTADDVVVRAEPARDIISLRRTVPSFAAARSLIGELREQSRRWVPRNGLMLVGVAHSPAFEADEIDVEFGLVLPDGSELEPPMSSPLRRRTLEAVARLATCVRVGLPEDAHLVTARIGRFLEIHGDSLAGPSRELFLKPPDPERMHESVVEMQFSMGPPRN